MLKLKIPLFETGTIEVYTDRRKAKRAFARLGIAGDVNQMDGCFAYEAYDTHGVFVLCVFDGRLGSVAHESFHAAVRILHTVGVPLLPNSPNEAHAYLVDYLVSRISKHMEVTCN